MRLRRSFKLRWIDLVSPCTYWPYPHSIEQALLAYKYLVVTAEMYCHVGASPIRGLLSKNPPCLYTSVSPLQSISDLQHRFHWALLFQTECDVIQQWRTDNRITLMDECVIPGRHFKVFRPGAEFASESDVRSAINGLFAAKNKKLNVRFNEYHHRAIWLKQVLLDVVYRDRLRWTIEYGYCRDRTGWFQTLATQENSETPIELLRRAIDQLEEWTK